MLAGDIYAPGMIRLIDVPEPQLASDSTGEIIFKPELGCLCGSDLLYFDGHYPEFQPEVGHTLHELIGTVVASSGNRFSHGDHVLCVPDEQRGLFERFCVDENQAIPLDPRPPREQALLAQPLGTVLCALKKIPHLMDLDVVVVGQGPIGQLFCAALRNVGARKIIAVDRIASRLASSTRMGANTTIDATQQDPIATVSHLTGGAMADLVIEAVGHRDVAINLCIDLCCRGGRILQFGVPGNRTDAVRWHTLLSKNITVHTSVGPSFDRDFPLAMRWISEQRVDVSPIITHRYPLAELQLAFDTFRERRDGALKVIIDFST